MVLAQKKALIIISTLILVGSVVGIAFRGEICFKYNSLVYENEISFAKHCIELLIKGDTEKIKRIFIDNARFLKDPAYLEETSEFLKHVNVNEIILDRISYSKEDNKNILFLDFYTPDRDNPRSIRLKMINVSNCWLLYSVMIG